MEDIVFEINRENLLHNVRVIREMLPNFTKFCAVVKCDAYGHGMSEVCELIHNFVDYFAVTNNTEAVALKKEFPSAKVLVLGALSTKNLLTALRLGVEVSLESEDELPLLSRYAKKANRQALIHIKVDTGMHRLGLNSVTELYRFFERLRKFENITLAGLFSHLGSGDSYSKRNYEQIMLFQRFADLAPVNVLKHLCNSAFYADNPCYDMVRVGIGLYGYGMPKVKPVMEVRARIVSIKSVKAGEFIGYGNKHKAKHDMKIATIAIGYGEGVPRIWSRHGYVLVDGKKCRFVANICMDMSIIDVSKTNAKIGDYATILGTGKNAQITAKDIAKGCKTIEYEILTNFKKAK